MIDPIPAQLSVRSDLAFSSVQDVNELEKLLRQASENGQAFLHTTEDRDVDPVAMKLVQARLDIVRLVFEERPDSIEKETSQKNALFNLCSQDPYLKELQASILSPEVCKTWSMLQHERNFLLALSNPDSLATKLDRHKSSMSLLRKIGEALAREVAAAQASAVAIRKASLRGPLL